MKYKLLDSESKIQEFNASLDPTVKQVGLIAQGDYLELTLSNNTLLKITPEFLPLVNLPEAKYNKVLYGKNSLEGIVGAEADGENLILFVQSEGKTLTKIVPNRLWVAALKNHEGMFTRLDGDREYQWIRYYKDVEKWQVAKKLKYKLDIDLYYSYCPVESNFISRGFTYFKGLQVKDVPVLSFDIETDGLEKTKNSDIYLISNTYRNGDQVEQKLFDFHDFSSTGEMLNAWCEWVREKNPAIMLGHNIYGYDLPYLNHVASLNDVSLNLGRDGSAMTINSYPSKFRKDGNEDIEYTKCNIWGRELVDTYFLSFKYDIGRKYESNGLKQIIKQEGLEKAGRVFVDAGKIKMHKDNPEMWTNIAAYAKDDSDDALKLFDLMAPAFFYFNQTTPKKFSEVMVGATGSQLNSVLVRSYLQDGKSIPKPSPRRGFQGAISHSVPGIYRNVWKVDVASEYPSVIRHFKLYNKKKDPEGYYLYITEELTKQRLEYKELGKTNSYYKDLDAATKVSINSLYGLCGATGLNFNDMDMGEFITAKGRDIVDTATVWATGRDAASWGWAPEGASDGET